MAGMTGGSNNAEGGGSNNKSKSTNAPQAPDGSLKRKRGIFSKDCEFFFPFSNASFFQELPRRIITVYGRSDLRSARFPAHPTTYVIRLILVGVSGWT